MSSSSAPASHPSSSAGLRILSRLASPLFSPKGRSIADFHIKARDPHKQYSPGETVAGHVVVKVVKPVRVTHISVCLHGFAQVYRNPGSSQDQLRGNSGRIGHGKGKKSGEYFGNGFASLFEDEAVLCGEGRLDEGMYRFDFEMQFPDDMDLPSSIDFERGTISYMVTATLTRPTTIAPVMSHDQKIYLVERLDIAPLLPPNPRTITLEPVARRPRPKASSLPKNSPRDDLTPVHSLSNSLSNSNSLQQPPAPTPSLSEQSQDSRVSSSLSSDGPHRTIHATVELLKGACLRGDSFPVKININHTKHIKSINGIIITLYRSARVDMHPALPLGSSSEGQKPKYEDYYPKSITGLGGLSLSGAGSSHTFRKDLSQILVPLIVNPVTLTAEINAKIGVPHSAFPTITSVPGAMISFRYYIEVVLDIQGKLTHDRYLSQHGSGPPCTATRPVPSAGDNEHFTSPEESPFLMLNGAGILDTAPIRRDKSVATCTFEVVVGTVDTERKKAKGKARAAAPPPPPLEHDQDTLNTSQYSQQNGLDEPVSPGYSLHPSHHQTNYNPDNLHGPSSDSYHDYTTAADQWHDGHDYQYDEYYESVYYEPPPIEDEDALPEKERLRRAEARLMPSQPPPLPEALSACDGPSAPIIPSGDEYHVSEASDAGPSHTTTRLPFSVARESHENEFPPQVLVGSTPDLMNSAPDDDKQELRRRQLQLAASAPPTSSNHGAVLQAHTEPSAPHIIGDESEHTNGDPERAAEHLPRYQR